MGFCRAEVLLGDEPDVLDRVVVRLTFLEGAALGVDCREFINQLVWWGELCIVLLVHVGLPLHLLLKDLLELGLLAAVLQWRPDTLTDTLADSKVSSA